MEQGPMDNYAKMGYGVMTKLKYQIVDDFDFIAISTFALHRIQTFYRCAERIRHLTFGLWISTVLACLGRIFTLYKFSNDLTWATKWAIG